jgi:hypothetical protein
VRNIPRTNRPGTHEGDQDPGSRHRRNDSRVIWLFPQPSRLPQAFAAAGDMTDTGWACMCPVGTMGGEIADTEPELGQVTAEIIASWAGTAPGTWPA